MQPTNKILEKLRAEITKEKNKESKFEKDRDSHKMNMTNIRLEIEKSRDKISELNKKKYDMK